MKDPIKLSFTEWSLAKQLADRRMKANNGHAFITMLKTRCQHCGRSPKAKGRCGGWFHTFLGHLDVILMNLETERAALHAPEDPDEEFYPPRPENRPLPRKQRRRIWGQVYCGDCDGVGWTEGGPTLKTTCRTCAGTGLVAGK